MDAWDKMLVVCGPTATGKTDLALALARRFGGELVNADSMQVYRGLVVGTAAPTPEEAGDIPVHLSGFLAPEQSFSVAAWVQMARACISEISARGRLPIVCGGTGLYISSLLGGIAFDEEDDADGLRSRLEADWDACGGAEMLARLARLDPERAALLHVRDKKRILRALQQVRRTGMTAKQREAASRQAPVSSDALCIGLDYAQRAALYAAIEQRVDKMMQAGLLDEARQVFDMREQYRTAVQAIGYKEFFPYFEGGAALDDCVAKLKQATRNYAKRQLTWFRRMENLHWLQAATPHTFAQAETLAINYI